MGVVALNFDLLTLKLVCESHQRWRTSLPNIGTPGLLVLELFAMYATDGQTDKSNAYCPLPYGRGIIVSTTTVQPAMLTQVLEYSNLLFTVLFAVEMMLKLIADGPLGYIRDGFNVFDGFIVVLRLVSRLVNIH